MSRWWSGLRARLLWVLVPVLIGLFLLDSWNDSINLQHELEKAYDQSLLEPAQALADDLGIDSEGAIRLMDTLHVVSMFEAVHGRRKLLRVQMQTPDGSRQRLLLGLRNFPEPAHDPLDAHRSFRDAADGTQMFYNAMVEHRPVRVAAMLRVLHDRSGQEWRVLIQAAQSTSNIDRSLHLLLWDSLLSDTRTLLVLVLVIWFGIAWGLRPLHALRHAIGQRSSDDLEPLVTDDVPAEVRPVIDAMNLHLEQQRQALETQRQFLADASHQLRTPLAIMTTQAGYALRETDPAAVHATLQGIQQQLSRSRRVAEQLLALAHASQATAAPGDVGLCDANAVARSVVLAYLPLALDKQQDLGWSDARGEGFEDEDAGPLVAPVQASSMVVYEMLANLLHNAISYTPVGGQINVSVVLEPKQVRIGIEDDGPGIAPEDRERVFQRFERLQAADGEATTGSGLGLSIARAYAQRMHGQVSLADGSTGRGLQVWVVLPLAATSVAA